MAALSTADFILRCRSEIRHIPYLSVTWVRKWERNHDHVSQVSPSTIANASGKTLPLPSCVVAINRVPLYLPYKCVPST